MRYADERKLAADIKNRRFLPVYLLVGDDAFLKTSYRSRLMEASLEGDSSGFNLLHFPGGKLDLGELSAALDTMPLFGGRRCVVVDDINPEKLLAGELKEWAAILDNLPPDALLLLVQRTPQDSAKKKAAESFYSLIDDAGGAVVTLEGRKGSDLVNFVRRRCEEAGAIIEPGEARHLIERVGEDMALLNSECGKLSSCAGEGGQITAKMIDALSPATVEADVFRLSRHIIAGDTQKALLLLDALFYLKTPPVLIIATLGGAFCDLYRAKAGLEKGFTQEQIVKDFAYRHAFRVKNALRDARPLKRADIEAAMAALIDADILMKTTQQDDRLLVERAVVRAAAALRGKLLP